MMFKRRFFGRIGTRKISRFATAAAVSFRRRYASVDSSVGHSSVFYGVGRIRQAREMGLGLVSVARVPIRKTQ